MVDIVDIKIKAGKGGDGNVSFIHEKYVAKGGPDGGDGGNGGSIYFVADNNMSTLIDFRSRALFEAESGQRGGAKKMLGKSGEDLKIKVPMGTLIYEVVEDEDSDSGKRYILVSDLVNNGDEFLIAKGGIGGRGNINFKSSRNRTPVQYTPGTKGEEKDVRLEIKMIADIGLIGSPNAGKSTLLNSLTNANAKVANYPFTTLSPNLGVYKVNKDHNIVIADIPGLIEGASEGKGLGEDFLRHIERTRVLIHMIDPMNGSSDDLVSNALEEYKIIRKEVENYGKDIDKKTSIVVINKIDVTEIREVFEDIKREFEKIGISVFGISSVTGEGVGDLIKKAVYLLEDIPRHTFFEAKKVVKRYNIENLPNRRVVFDKGRILEKEGKI
jgi:GTP-binding protein